jgi:hypothetical protein
MTRLESIFENAILGLIHWDTFENELRMFNMGSDNVTARVVGCRLIFK